jgi:hypothetical protein
LYWYTLWGFCFIFGSDRYSTTDSIKKNIPTQSIGNKTTLPWVTPQIKKLINKKNKLFKKKTLNSEHTKIYKEVLDLHVRLLHFWEVLYWCFLFSGFLYRRIHFWVVYWTFVGLVRYI